MELIGHLRAVRVLCAVDAHGSFSGAARDLGLTQSAVSQHVAALERHLGVALVDRASRPAGLTEAGLALVRHGQAVLARLEGAEQELAEIDGRRAGRLRFGSFPTALTSFVPPALARFRAAHPGVTLTVVDDHLQRLLPRLDDGELDVALLYEHEELREVGARDLERTVLLDDPFVVVLPAGHALAGARSPLDVRRLRDLQWIGGTTGAGWWRIVRRACRDAGFDPNVWFASDDYAAVLAFVAAGLGVSVVPRLAVHGPRPDVVVRPLQRTVRRRVVAVRPRDAFQPAAGETMVRILEEVTRR